MKIMRVVGLFLLFCCFNEGFGMRIVPFIHSFSPKNSVFQYYLANLDDQKVAFEVTIYKRTQDLHGQDVLEKDDRSFLVFPSQIIVPGKGERIVKVRWVGNEDFEKNPNKEQAFRIVFDQFNINFSGKKQGAMGASMEVRLRVVASLFMTPEGASANLKITSKNESVVNGKKTCVIKMKNEGTAHCISKLIALKAVIFGKEYTVGDVLNESDKSVPLLVDTEREFTITEETINKWKESLKKKEEKK